MTDEVKFSILNLVNTERLVLGTDHSTVLNYLCNNDMDIKTANAHINSLLEEGWLEKSTHSMAAYTLTNKSIIWLHDYAVSTNTKKKKKSSFLGKIIVIVTTLAAFLAIIWYLLDFYKDFHHKP